MTLQENSPPCSLHTLIYLFQVLDNSSESLILCLNIGDHRPALLQLVLHLQNLPKVISFFGCGLLEESLFTCLTIFSNFAVNREGLSKCLREENSAQCKTTEDLEKLSTITNSCTASGNYIDL